MPKLEFWYDFSSTYSYLAAMRIERVAAVAGVDVEWRPFILGPIFKAQGWTTSPFNLYPVKGRHMVRDIERIAGERGIAFALPKVFPANSILACRLALLGEAPGWTPRFTTAVYDAEFAQGKDIAAPETLSAILTDIGVDAATAIAQANEQSNKDKLFQRTADAQVRGIFGAPSFITASGELFWGDDRLEQALAWTRR
jgi:2-hydroxychromene-2-carboxylate isomerase